MDMAGIDHVLAGRAEMNPFGLLGSDCGDARGQRLHQRDRRIAGQRRGPPEFGDVVEIGVALSGNGIGRALRRDRFSFQRTREHRLEAEHAVQQRPIAYRIRHLAIDEEFAEEARVAAGHGDGGAMRRAGPVLTRAPPVQLALVRAGASAHG